ncbi:MAG: UDP-3-O-(3-hydroxymyristoyl)glucosamine N-acyltransferase, partial [Verrucomicrobia bacterium]|nr:UDP-3-O-(3-hydroxymyristoyl)glucosamine N-acyltransferase [Verrucomicrobiota bacterium]
ECAQGRVLGDGSAVLSGVASADTAKAGDLTFAENADFLRTAENTDAAAVLVPEILVSSTKTLIVVRSPRVAMARILAVFAPPDVFDPGIHAAAVIHASARVDPTSHIGPHCVLGPDVRVGARSVLLGGNHIGRGARVGEDVRLFPNVVVYPACEIRDRVSIHAGTVIGSDGYGYVLDQGRHRKVPQLGNVVIESDVEIGSNASIDRAAFGSTVIGQGTKIDNLVHVAHNVVMGRHCLVMGQVGFAGSTHLGDYCVIASQSGIAGHLRLGHQSTVGAKSGVMRDVPDKATVLGIPAMPDKQTKRQWISLQQLPEMLRRMRELERQLESLTAAQSAASSRA